MILSPFTPLFFISHKTDGLKSDYVQTFATSDRILIELIGEASDNIVGQVYLEPEHKPLFSIEWSGWAVNSKTYLRFAALRLSPGLYSLGLSGFGQSEPFMVTDDDAILNKTTLIQYSMRNNRQRNDALFFIDGMQYFFDFRVHGGFKDSNWSFGIDNEQFVTPHADISQLYGMESTQKKFTLGTSSGVPVWFGEMLNRILVCSHVYFDGVKYSRKESDVPEISQQIEGLNSFIFTQTLQQAVNLDPVVENSNQLRIRRTESFEYRAPASGYDLIV